MDELKRHRISWALVAMAIAMVCSACGPTEAELETATEVATIAPVSPTLTPALKQTPTHTPSNILSPTHTPIGGGEKIAFASNRDGNFEIYMMKPDGSEQRRLTHLDENNYAPEFSPDGEIILFMAVDLETDPPIAEIQFIRTDGTGWGILGQGVGSVSWSPISDEVVFMDYWEPPNADIVKAEFDGMVERLTTDPAYDEMPVWSPDGQVIAFVSDVDGLVKIYLMDPDGSNKRRATDSEMTEYDPAWSPDGSRIAFVSGDTVNTQIFIMDSDGSNPFQVTDGVGYNEQPAWSPDGRMLAFWSNRSGNAQIYAIGIDGTGLERLSTNTFHEESPDWSH